MHGHILVFFGYIWVHLFVNWKAFQGRIKLTTQETLVRAEGELSLRTYRLIVLAYELSGLGL